MNDEFIKYYKKHIRLELLTGTKLKGRLIGIDDDSESIKIQDEEGEIHIIRFQMIGYLGLDGDNATNPSRINKSNNNSPEDIDVISKPKIAETTINSNQATIEELKFLTRVETLFDSKFENSVLKIIKPELSVPNEIINERHSESSRRWAILTNKYRDANNKKTLTKNSESMGSLLSEIKQLRNDVRLLNSKVLLELSGYLGYINEQYSESSQYFFYAAVRASSAIAWHNLALTLLKLNKRDIALFSLIQFINKPDTDSNDLLINAWDNLIKLIHETGQYFYFNSITLPDNVPQRYLFESIAYLLIKKNNPEIVSQQYAVLNETNYRELSKELIIYLTMNANQDHELDINKLKTIICSNNNDKTTKSLKDTVIIHINGSNNSQLNLLNNRKELSYPTPNDELNDIIPANGSVNYFNKDKQFGFIINMYGKQIYFNTGNIIDPQLKNMIWQEIQIRGTQIIYTPSTNLKGDSAILIHKPKTVEKALLLANDYKLSEPRVYLGILDQILSTYPNNTYVQNIKIEFSRTLAKNNLSRINTYKNNGVSDYQKATYAKNVEKDLPKALIHYQKALQNNEKKESCIKDIGSLYVTLGEREKALEFMNNYILHLPNNSSTYYYLENFYYSLKDYKNAIKFIDLAIKGNGNFIHRAIYLQKKATALYQIGEIESAIKILDDILRYDPENLNAQRLLSVFIDNNTLAIDQIIAETEFYSFGSGISVYLRNILDKYEQYHGLPAKLLESRKFTKETLNGLRKLIETAGRSRPRERANYLLTEAKLMEQLEPEYNIRSVLAKYCNAMALNHISEKSPIDIVRFFYLEAFSCEDEYIKTAPQAALYLMSYARSYGDLLSNKTPSMDEALSTVLKYDHRSEVWDGILNMILWNSSIAAQVLRRLYDNPDFRNRSLEYLNFENKDIEFNDYKGLWNLTREKRQRDFTRWLAKIKSIYSSDNLDVFVNHLVDTLNPENDQWITHTDKLRLNSIRTDIYDSLLQYLRHSGYRDKERSMNEVQSQINMLISNIQDLPTYLSYTGLIPLLEQLAHLLSKSFKIVEDTSTPQVKINILGEANVLDNDNYVFMQISVENSKESSPIRDIVIEISNDENILKVEGENSHYDSLDGGEHCIIRLHIKLSDRVKLDMATTVKLKCTYVTRASQSPIQIDEQLPLRLYSVDEFKEIFNPYAPIADGGPVVDRNMFFGREEFIDNQIKTILSAETKQIIIYGQKRSGKSSVLHHLKNGLEARGNVFCVLFSLGLIIQDLSDATFYYHILQSLDKELKKLRRNSKLPVPNFSCPSYEEYKDTNSGNPALAFLSYLELYYELCQRLEEWKAKKLVFLIDEFTYLYTSIKQGRTSDTIMKQWKAVTQNDSVKFSVVLVGQDVVPSFKKEEYARNAFGVITDIRLTYLDEKDARRLVTEPILDEKNESRFIGNAVDTIIDYTSCNPYYINIFCARLVEYMNSKKIIKVTEADVKDVANTFIEGNHALAPEKFDNLVRAGEEYDFIEYNDEDVFTLLRQIAQGAKNIGTCSRENINLANNELEDKILSHLVDREVLSLRPGNNYKIIVRLFQEWLLKH